MEEEFAGLFRFAIKNEASDIHLTRVNDVVVGEIRVACGMRKYRKTLDPQLIRYLTYKADLDLLDSHRPQTGHMDYVFLKHVYELRVAHVRSGNTENIVIRILTPYTPLKFDGLFENDQQKATMMRLLGFEQGLLLISGSTGSGKTTTLYQCLHWLLPQKIVTIEDPIEKRIDGLVQFQINHQKKFGFEEAIKQVLRHDPNIIVIGEIRDEREAKAVLRIALSGHLVISTIHANSMRKTITRMKNFGVDPIELNEALIGIVYQKMEVDEDGKRKVRFDLFENDDLAL